MDLSLLTAVKEGLMASLRGHSRSGAAVDSDATFQAWLAGRRGEAAVSAALRHRFQYVADDVILPDGRGGLTQIDHLALIPTGLLVVETKNYSGLILGRASEPTWTKVVGRQRIAFQNPLRQNFAHLAAVRALAPGLPIHGRVVFLDQAGFPKGPPTACSRFPHSKSS
jgi:hypothetical protein